MVAEVIAVGTELLMGQILNTNAQFLAQELSALGIDLHEEIVVGDNRARLRDAVARAMERSDVLIITGGLGPTEDDLTKETVAEVFGAKLVLDEESLHAMEDYVRRGYKTLPENNRKQAYLPEGGTVIPNHNGTAPGCMLEKDGKVAILLPGPPSEMRLMFRESVLPYLQQRSGACLYSRVLRMFGIGESDAALQLADLIAAQTNPTIAPYAKEGEVTFRITAKAATAEEGAALCEPMVEAVRARLGRYMYAEGDDASMEACVLALLRERGETLATAESCTGGLIAEKLTSIPGASTVFGFGVVTYANEAKMRLLGVKEETLAAYGAVSAETAREMADGARRLSGADYAVAVTGIAGPDGGTAEKPVGLVYCALASKDGTRAEQCCFSGNRERVRQRTYLTALNMVREKILETT